MCWDKAVWSLNGHGESTEAEASLLSHQLLKAPLGLLAAAHPDLGPLSYQDRTKCLTDGNYPPPASLQKERKTQGWGGRVGEESKEKERNQREINVFH